MCSPNMVSGSIERIHSLWESLSFKILAGLTMLAYLPYHHFNAAWCGSMQPAIYIYHIWVGRRHTGTWMTSCASVGYFSTLILRCMTAVLFHSKGKWWWIKSENFGIIQYMLKMVAFLPRPHASWLSESKLIVVPLPRYLPVKIAARKLLNSVVVFTCRLGQSCFRKFWIFS